MKPEINPVPESYHGVWQRTHRRNQDGSEDRSSQIFWLQTQYYHADIRLSDSPSADIRSRAASMSGCAGLTEVNGDRCQWHRVIDFHPDTPTDIGRMEFTGPEEMIERATDGSWEETWQRLPDSSGPLSGQWLMAGENEARMGCLVTAGDYFVFAADRPEPLVHGSTIASLSESGDQAALESALKFEISMGRIDDGDKPWIIERSTLDDRVGQSLMAQFDAPSPKHSEFNSYPDMVLDQLGAYPARGGWVGMSVTQIENEKLVR